MKDVPATRSLEMVELFLDRGEAVDSANLQFDVAKKTNLDLLRFVVERTGPQIPIDTKFRGLIDNIMYENHRNILCYLKTNYGFDVNATFPICT